MSIAVREIGEAGIEIDVQDLVEDFADCQFLPKAEHRIENVGVLDLLIRISDFRGWAALSLWETLEFGKDRFQHVRRLALVGDEITAKWLAVMAEPFPNSDVRYFAVDDLDEARQWICAGHTGTSTWHPGQSSNAR